MEFEMLKAMNDGLYPGLLTMMEFIALITVFLAIIAFAISLACIAWLCFEESRQPVLPRIRTSKTQKLDSASVPGLDQNSSLIAHAPQSSAGANFNSVS